MAISLNDLGQINRPQVENTLNNMKDKTSSDEKKMEVCKEFEAYLVEQVYKSMEKTVEKSSDEGDYEKMFSDMRIQQYAKAVVDQGNLGIANRLYEAMKNNDKGL